MALDERRKLLLFCFCFCLLNFRLILNLEKRRRVPLEEASEGEMWWKKGKRPDIEKVKSG